MPICCAGTAKGCGSIDTSGLGAHAGETGGKHNKQHVLMISLILSACRSTPSMAYSDVKAGETITIDGKSKKPLLSQQISYFDDVYSVLSQDNMNGNTYSYKHKDMDLA